MDALTPDVKRRLYRSVFRLRRIEERLADLYREQTMRTPAHFGVGQEAVASGVCEALGARDVVYSHHRCHNHYLARGGKLAGLAAELYGRIDGCARGRGGSVHLTARDQGFIVSSAILGQTVAVACGSALAFRMDGVPGVAVSFFGEATCEEGVFYESLNYAAINRLPVLFVCENNLYSTESPLSVRQPAGTALTDRAAAFKVEAHQVDGNDVFEVWNAARHAVDSIRSGGGPVFLECMTYRWLEHVGPKFDHEAGRSYRSREELDHWIARCPVRHARERLLAEGLVSKAELDAWSDAVEQEIDDAVATARDSAWPDAADLFENVH
ncbi:thiamine pyrophosphate-dependent dehydrogenase E1 component subunit alpha [Azospirillum cavernae]|uniref:Thiamine pyrophosphate-dependent dehydrogenase E1 component subunit alpha n=2 Tax=Azospirillum cavernae TaxID=2320860 RepID=A0A418VL74_9PROT|nr:thiamine pyrophosphate-dependent dehydrogenase E1 component subunit alpha [Azospirillum cavernae]